MTLPHKKLSWCHTGVINRRNYYGDDSVSEADLPIHLNVVQCSGGEDRLIDCPWQLERTSTNCNHFEDAGVSCILTNSSLLPGESSPTQYDGTYHLS